MAGTHTMATVGQSYRTTRRLMSGQLGPMIVLMIVICQLIHYQGYCASTIVKRSPISYDNGPEDAADLYRGLLNSPVPIITSSPSASMVASQSNTDQLPVTIDRATIEYDHEIPPDFFTKVFYYYKPTNNNNNRMDSSSSDVTEDDQAPDQGGTRQFLFPPKPNGHSTTATRASWRGTTPQIPFHSAPMEPKFHANSLFERSLATKKPKPTRRSGCSFNPGLSQRCDFEDFDLAHLHAAWFKNPKLPG